MNAIEAQHWADLDRRLVAAVKDIRILPSLAWPASLQQRMIDAWRNGHETLPRLPADMYPKPALSETRAELRAIEHAARAEHPVAAYLRRSARSWHLAVDLLEAAGSSGVTAPSTMLYGRPGDTIPGSQQTNLDAARHFVAVADELGSELANEELVGDIPASTLRDDLAHELDAFFGPGTIRVEVDPDLTAKAAAGATRIRLRGGVSFNRYDRHQLLAHEAFVHSLTALNGRQQPYLTSLARTAPRVTSTQEGLAVFAELISGSIDIARLKRISLRILAIDMALDGADFVEVCRFFLERGQSIHDSFHSTQRVFRGAPLTGGAAFTKDNVYLSGLLSVHTFFRWALRHGRMDLTRHLFAGKLAIADVISLEPAFADGLITPPRYLPAWMQQTHGLAGKLAFSLFINSVHMQRVDVDDLA